MSSLIPTSENHANKHASIDVHALALSPESEGHVQMPPSSTENPYNGTQLTERELLSLVALARMLHQDGTVKAFALKVVAQLAALRVLSLSERINLQSTNLTPSPNTKNSILSLILHYNAIIASETWRQTMLHLKATSDIADLVDGSLLTRLCEGEDILQPRSKYMAAFDQMSQVYLALTGVSLAPLKEEFIPLKSALQVDDSSAGHCAVLPFYSPVFDKHLVAVRVEVASAPSSTRNLGRIHQEIVHWHNAKRVIGVKPKILDPRQQKRLMRRDNFFMAEMQAYAASLTNAAGKTLEPEIITVMKNVPGNSSNPNSRISSDPDVKNTSKATKPKHSTKQQLMKASLASSQALKESQNAEKALAAWRNVRRILADEKRPESLYTKLMAYERSLDAARRVFVQTEVAWNVLVALIHVHVRNVRNSERLTDPHLSLMALIWYTARKLGLTEGLFSSLADQLRSAVANLGLPDFDIKVTAPNRKLTYDPDLPVLEKMPTNKLNPHEFQLLYAGPYMDRNLDSAKDSRVPSFQPDRWQRQVLDELDRHNSIFVVAPTSSGKTFISFYAMEQILRYDDEGVLVYVAPTKALVNQVAAEIQARFSKKYKYGGKSVWAIHTRDYRINNPTGCQILVTVPHILQIMLLAPKNAKSWSTRVKYIIFDEIHSIGQAEDGVVWEQLLLLAPCPVICLSATVGNPDAFSSWLAATQAASGVKLTTIQHSHRYSELRKFAYIPPNSFHFHGLTSETSFGVLGLDGLDGFNYIHPCASLIERSRGMPEDLNFEARDCFLLFNAMSKQQTKNYPIDSSLGLMTRNPNGVIVKADIISWEKKLKAVLQEWMTDYSSPYDKVIEELSERLRRPRKSQEQYSGGNGKIVAEKETLKVDASKLEETTLPLLCQLHERNALPAIIFNYERFQCVRICQSLVSSLEDAEAAFKAKDYTWQKKMTDFEEWKRRNASGDTKNENKKLTKKNRSEHGGPDSKADKMYEAASRDADPFNGFDPDEPLDGFHFAVKHKAEAEELDSINRQFIRKGLASWLMAGLKRGIGVHHAGMNRKYRQVVEMLFRKGYIRVVIATGTLALGINMPCATVVFAGDSVFLTALNYRQAAGRAGRRGFDLLGNVVFQGLSESKVLRLMSSRLPDLNGHFPVSTLPSSHVTFGVR